MIPADQLAIMDNTPSWATAAFAIAVWFGLLGCILLLIRKKLAKLLFIISIFGVIVQMIYNFFMTNAIEVFGTASLIQPLIVLLIGIFLIWYSKKCADDGILS
jgi:hypothetical protein